MQFSRRDLLPLAAGVALLPGSRAAQAESYPSRPIRVIVALPAGSGTDVLARIMAQWLSDQLGQSVVVDNRPGSGGNIGTEVVAKAAPDGYTLLFTLLANAINQTLYTGLAFDFVRDIVPVASVCTTNFAMSVNPSLPAQRTGAACVHLAAVVDCLYPGRQAAGAWCHDGEALGAFARHSRHQ